jgi:radical SAM protein with 4Fe4S-binding SPASM domain
VKIDPDGRVLPCYRAWDALSMGNVGDDGVPFGDLWNSESYQALRRTVNDDGVPKHFPYCARCEYRFGWGDLEQHVGYEQWAETVAGFVAGRGKEFDHRRDKRAGTGR